MKTRDFSLETHGADADMQYHIDGAIQFVQSGDRSRISLPLKGLEVFAIICALRENDDQFHAEQVDDEVKQRVEQLETWVDDAVKENQQYYPFGENKERRVVPTVIYNRMNGDETSWGIGGRKNLSSGGHHGGEFVEGEKYPYPDTYPRLKKSRS